MGLDLIAFCCLLAHLLPTDWNDVLMGINPYYFGFVGVAVSIGFCVMGAAW
jgi:hypothetical protein